MQKSLFGTEVNPWIEMSIEYANQRSYLDDLFSVYPTIPDGIRDIDKNLWDDIENHFNERENEKLVRQLLKLNIFPIKDSYIAYLKRDQSSISRNPRTINRISGRLYEMGLDKILLKSTESKETNRQIGPMFRRWLNNGSLGLPLLKYNEFSSSEKDGILDSGDKELKDFAHERLNYNRNKGLDFVIRFKGKYVIGESKFLSDFGGHQNAQFNDSIYTVETEGVDAIMVAILDGVLYIKGNNKMYKDIITTYKHLNIMSALVFREFLYQI